MSINNMKLNLVGLSKLGRFGKWVNSLYENRKMAILFLVHFFLTMVIWAHFAHDKFRLKEARVPEGANRYWWKRGLPSLEFGSMHALLFQMALLPFTMCRFSVTQLALTPLRYYIPFNRITAMHIHIGYVLVGIVFLASIFFFAFFGMLCQEQKDRVEKLGKLGERTFCLKFVDEIMITGYFILGLLLIMAGTSYFRAKIPYEVFYIVHHLFFVVFMLTIAHTVDAEQRHLRQNRSQAWKWISFPLVYYITERIYMAASQKMNLAVVDATALADSADGSGAKMVVLRLKKPAYFRFQPGQYISMNIPSIDRTWHPFSIASDDSARTLDFYIEVFTGDWTQLLWENIRHNKHYVGAVNIMGPYGTGLGDTRDFTDMVALGTGTGIVPMISHLRSNISHLVRLEPSAFYDLKHRRREEQHRIYLATKGHGNILEAIASIFLRHHPARNLVVPVSGLNFRMEQAGAKILLWFKKWSLKTQLFWPVRLKGKAPLRPELSKGWLGRC
jgi:predicted ferric reductase